MKPGCNRGVRSIRFVRRVDHHDFLRLRTNPTIAPAKKPTGKNKIMMMPTLPALGSFGERATLSSVIPRVANTPRMAPHIAPTHVHTNRFKPCFTRAVPPNGQRPGPHGAWIATGARWQGSLQRIVTISFLSLQRALSWFIVLVSILQNQ